MISPADSDPQAKSEAELIAARLVELLPIPPLLGIPRREGIDFPQVSGGYGKFLAWIAIAAAFLILAVFGG